MTKGKLEATSNPTSGNVRAPHYFKCQRLGQYVRDCLDQKTITFVDEEVELNYDTEGDRIDLETNEVGYADRGEAAIGVSSRLRKGKGDIAFWAIPNLVVWARYAFWTRGHVATNCRSEIHNNPAYQMNPKEYEELHRQVAELVEKGLIRESMSPFVVPALLVPKHGGTFHMCIDSQVVNKINIKYRFPIPRFDDLLDQLYGATVFSKIDMRSGYHQIRMRSKDEWKTTFKTRDGLHEWMVMPFSLFNAPMAFEGYIISGNRIKMDDSKIEAIINWLTPTKIHEIRCFHGLASFYRRFIKNFSTTIAPITKCVKGGHFPWTDEATKSFEFLKLKVTQAPVLTLPNFNEVFYVECDASGVGISGILSQNS
ncbi:reverse transcriptase domain-containing protein [Tanacetum coccineum]